jgi:SAM-dependent methyltransferase
MLAHVPEAHHPARTRTSSRLEWLLFAATATLSAFLLFLVQPLVAKHILPWFGGAPAVWNVCMAFYQSALFAGYLYAHLLITRVPSSRQIWVHGALVVAALAALPVLPDASWRPAGDAAPGIRICLMLVSSVGLPFVALAGTGPIVQALFAKRFLGRSPYPLYALSNLGSLVALLCFPFVLEPWLSLSTASPLWSGGFAISCGSVLACVWLAASRGSRASPPIRSELDRGHSGRPAAANAEQRIAWLLLPACAVVLLMGVTNLLCLDVASVPLLWVVPLALYLTTFILCFASERNHRPGLFVALALFALISDAALNDANFGILWKGLGVDPVYDEILSLTALLFAGCMLLHGMLQRLRPPAEQLTTYYLSISAGGAIGGIFVGLLAPILFNDYDELPLGMLASWAALGVLSWREGRRAGRAARRRLAFAAASVCLAVLCGVQLFYDRDRSFGEVVFQKRTFFGVLRVREKFPNDPKRHVKILENGTTFHGRELQDPAARLIPVSYFGPLTAIGMTLYDGPLRMNGLELDAAPEDRGRRIGIIGIGVGALAGYGRRGDEIVYYEIDPEVVYIARDSGHFDYLKDSRAQIDIVLGDGRLSLEREAKELGSRQFDVFVVDAFTSDAIPVHLLTREAFEVYVRHLRPDGVLAVHVSNRHLRLSPLVSRLGESVGLYSLQAKNLNIPGYLSGQSSWVLLSADEGKISQIERAIHARLRYAGVSESEVTLTRPDAADLASAPLWTDDFSNILSVLKHVH